MRVALSMNPTRVCDCNLPVDFCVFLKDEGVQILNVQLRKRQPYCEVAACYALYFSFVQTIMHNHRNGIVFKHLLLTVKTIHSNFVNLLL